MFTVDESRRTYLPCRHGTARERNLLTLPGGPTRVQWRRSARARRVSLRIDPGAGMVVVTLPPRASRRAGMSLLMTHADWVTDRLATAAAA